MTKKRNKDIAYSVLNILVLLLAAIVFVFKYADLEIFRSASARQIFIVTMSVVLVHIVKASRFYLALYGQNITPSVYIKTYCKVTPISLLFPYKIGELFRMYCYGRTIGNMLRGIIIVLLDRFIDTAALLTILVAMLIWEGGRLTALVYILIAFILLLLFIFFAFPATYLYWKKYLLRADATVAKNKMLRTLAYLNRIYREVENVIKGRGGLLYLLSIIAWAIEIGGVCIIKRLQEDQGALGEKILQYLSSALTGNQVVEMRQFVFISIVLLIAIYVFVKGAEVLRK